MCICSWCKQTGRKLFIDLVVFGRAAGKHINEELKSGGGVDNASNEDIELAMSRLNKLNESESGYEVADVKKQLQTCMQNYFGVFRRGEFMEKGVKELEEIREKSENLYLKIKVLLSTLTELKHSSYRIY